MKRIFVAVGLLLIGLTVARAAEWQHAGALYIITTPDGADLPDGAAEKDFPLLVRLSNNTFDFSQAGAGGEDIRFHDEAGNALAYEIEAWDAAAGAATDRNLLLPESLILTSICR
ncbi:MAG: hypothetical protein R6U98_28125 [Pirellulaceae bacterium]